MPLLQTIEGKILQSLIYSNTDNCQFFRQIKGHHAGESLFLCFDVDGASGLKVNDFMLITPMKCLDFIKNC